MVYFLTRDARHNDGDDHHPSYHRWTVSNHKLVTNPTLNVCETLRHLSLCEVRDVKDEDMWVLFASHLCSGKQLTAVMCLELRKQKPLSDALDG